MTDIMCTQKQYNRSSHSPGHISSQNAKWIKYVCVCVCVCVCVIPSFPFQKTIIIIFFIVTLFHDN